MYSYKKLLIKCSIYCTLAHPF